MAITRRFDGYDYRGDKLDVPLLAYVWEDTRKGVQYRQLFETKQEADDHEAVALTVMGGMVEL